MPPQKTNEDTANSVSQTLHHEVALITGASRGIGRAIALRLASLGASVAICGRDELALKNVAAELRATGCNVHWQAADVTRVKDIEALIAKVQATLGNISILVNNAGVGVFGPFHEKTEADWDRVIDTNLKSIFLVSRAVVPSMIQQGRGDIVNISSLAGHNAFVGGGIYCASKWGVQGLTGCMAEELREYGIRVSAVCPGSVATDFSGSGAKDSSKVLAAEDVAHAVAAIVSQGPRSFLSEILLRPLRKPKK
jgi:3-oxoacyl-[acyl-carrier protein] reductase